MTILCHLGALTLHPAHLDIQQNSQLASQLPQTMARAAFTWPLVAALLSFRETGAWVGGNVSDPDERNIGQRTS